MNGKGLSPRHSLRVYGDNYDKIFRAKKQNPKTYWRKFYDLWVIQKTRNSSESHVLVQNDNQRRLCEERGIPFEDIRE